MGFFGLHPGLALLTPSASDGRLAVLPPSHYPNASQSHFDGQFNIESGRPDRGISTAG